MNVVGVLGPNDDSKTRQLWQEGFDLYMQYANGQGGLRLGRDSVGYVNVSFLTLCDVCEFGAKYRELCSPDANVDALIAPLNTVDAGKALTALRKAQCTKVVLATAVSDQMFPGDDNGYRNLWSVSTVPSRWTDEPIDFL